MNNKIRNAMLQYGKQTIDDSDKQAILNVLDENNYLTTGPKVNEFENAVANFVNAKYAVAVNSGTSALHCAVSTLNLQKDDEVIVTCLSFVASSNCILYCCKEAKPVFCDIEEDTMNIDPNKIEEKITKNTKAIIVVDFAGQSCDYSKIKQITNKYNLVLIEDASHAIGGLIIYDENSNSKKQQQKYMIGEFADMTIFSFHPVKHITTCEGGMVVTNNANYYNHMKSFRSHGIKIDYKQREQLGSHYYEMVDLGYNYRIPDLLCALGINQLKRLPEFIKRRQEIAKEYDNAFKHLFKYLKPLKQKTPHNVYHIYVIQLELENLIVDRDIIFKELRNQNLGVNVHYMPIHLHPYYQKNLGTRKGLCPIAEKVYKQIITLPLFPSMTNQDIQDVIKIVSLVINKFKK